MLTAEALGELVNRQALAHDLRPDIVMCVVIQETKGDTFSWRWEEAFYDRRLKDKDRSTLSGWVPPPGTLPSIVDECLQRSCSYGLMQVLGDTARWCAKVTSPYLTVLCDPERGVDVGCRVLSFYLGQADGDYRKALKGYNGSFTYADEVLGRVQRGEHLKYFKG